MGAVIVDGDAVIVGSLVVIWSGVANGALPVIAAPEGSSTVIVRGPDPAQPSLKPLKFIGPSEHEPFPGTGVKPTMIVPTDAFNATVKLKAVPLTIVCVVVADASWVPVPFVPAKIKNANVSLPAGAPNESVQLREPATVVHKLEPAETSNNVSEPPLMFIATDCALGETNCG